MHCRHVVTSLLHAATNVCRQHRSSEENGVGEDAINTQQNSDHVMTLVLSEMLHRRQVNREQKRLTCPKRLIDYVTSQAI